MYLSHTSIFLFLCSYLCILLLINCLTDLRFQLRIVPKEIYNENNE